MNPAQSTSKASVSREERLLALVTERPAGRDRDAFLEAVCGEDAILRAQLAQRLAQAEEAAETLPSANHVQPPEHSALGIPVHPPDEAVGQTLGRYKLLEKIGEGGCGIVYVAEQSEPVRRRVALKVIKLGMDTRAVVARFEAERQALAMMDHPNIARVLDGGATETGRPFFVMELVRGVRVTDYCDNYNLSPIDRIELFIKVCLAIQHAHQKGIIHRDIKPSNILVTLHDGVPVPKVIDFGISKATDGRITDATVYTQLNQFIGTPAYMSPEQAEMSGLDVDTRSDIYSLGVLLYELLTGRTPFDGHELMSMGLDAMRKTIREKEPARPSTKLSTLHGDEKTTAARRRSIEMPKLVHMLRGDLDWIVMKCLEKDRTRRYETANGLAADLRRYLGNEPIVARPPSPGYRFSKAFHRNRVAFTAALAVGLALVLGMVVSLSQGVRASRAEKLAEGRLAESERARNEAEAISSFLAEVFRSPDPARDGRTITVAETLVRSAKKLETDTAIQGDRRATLQRTLGETYASLGLTSEALSLFEKVREYHSKAHGPEHPETLTAVRLVASCYHVLGRRDEAARMREDILKRREHTLGPEHPETAIAMSDLAESSDAAGRPEEAIRLQSEVLKLRQRIFGEEHPATIEAMKNLSFYVTHIGKEDQALRLREQSLAISRRINGPEHPETVSVMHHLAYSYAAAGRRADAVKLREEVVAARRKLLGPEHRDTLSAMTTLANSYFSVGRTEDALKIKGQAAALDPGMVDLSFAVFQLWVGRDAEYETTCLRFLKAAQNSEDPTRADVAAKATCLRMPAKPEMLDQALALARHAVASGHNHQALDWFQLALGMAELRKGNLAAAESALTAAEAPASDKKLVDTARVYRSIVLHRLGRTEEAQRLFAEVSKSMRPYPADPKKPLADGGDADDLILWLAYRESHAMLDHH